jgi:hypothetical protein
LLVVVLLLLLGLAVFSFTAALLAAAGALTVFVIRRFGRYVRSAGANLARVGIFVTLVAVGVGIYGAVHGGIFSSSDTGNRRPPSTGGGGGGDGGGGAVPPPLLQSLDLVVVPRGGNSFRVTYRGLVSPQRRFVQLGSRLVTAESAGLLLRQVEVPPLPLRRYKPGPGAVTRVELRKISHGSFYDARDAVSLAESSYLGSDVVRWNVTGVREPIAFAYTPEGWIFARRFLSPAGWIASLKHWMSFLLGGLLALVVWPVVLDLMRSRLRGRLERAPAST